MKQQELAIPMLKCALNSFIAIMLHRLKNGETAIHAMRSFEDAYETIHQILWADSNLYHLMQHEEVNNSLLPCIVFVGTENVGKTTLVEALLYGNVSAKSLPINFDYKVWATTLKLVDCPSFDTIYPTAQIAEQISNADLVVQVCDMDANIRRADIELSQLVCRYEKPHIVVINKIDLYSDWQRRRVTDVAQQNFSSVTCISALKRDGLENLLITLFNNLPEFHHQTVSSRLDRFSRRLKYEEGRNKVRVTCEKIIAEKTREAAGVGVGDKPDAAQLLAIQDLMIHLIAEKFSELGIHYSETPNLGQLSPNVVFFSAIIHSMKDRLPSIMKPLASFHAAEWTREMGRLAVEYFDQQITEEIVSLKIQQLLSLPQR